MAGNPGATRLRPLSWPKVGQSLAAGVTPGEGAAVVVALGAAGVAGGEVVVAGGRVVGGVIVEGGLVHAPSATQTTRTVSARTAAVRCMGRVCGRLGVATRPRGVAIG